MNNMLMPKISKLIDDIKKNKKAAAIIAVGLLGIVLIALSSVPAGEDKNVTTETDKAKTITENQITENLTSFLENIEGAGRVRVMITFESTAETVYACDTDENSDINTGNSEERKVKSEHIIIKSDNGEGGLEVKEIYPRVRGVAVICDGGDDPLIKEQVITIVAALFDINSTRISVAAMAA